MTSWATLTPKVVEVGELMALYGCTLEVDGDLFVVRHERGGVEQVASLDEVIDAAARLARSAC